MVAEPIQTRPIQSGATVAIVTIDMLFGQLPVGLRRDSRLQTLELLVNRLGLLLPCGRDPGVECHVHGLPPAAVCMSRIACRTHPPATAAGIGKRHPNVVGHHHEPQRCGVPSKPASYDPPARGLTIRKRIEISLPDGAVEPGDATKTGGAYSIGSGKICRL
jgi:hypothetical protein